MTLFGRLSDTNRNSSLRSEGPLVRTDTRYAAMIPALNGEIPVVVAAEGVAQINDAITWGKAENLRLVIRGGRDAIYVADRLKAENVPVILTSRADNVRARTASCAVAMLVAHARRQGTGKGK